MNEPKHVKVHKSRTVLQDLKKFIELRIIFNLYNGGIIQRDQTSMVVVVLSLTIRKVWGFIYRTISLPFVVL